MSATGRLNDGDVRGAHATQLFNRSGRRHGLKTDALIAAAEIRAGADFLTFNQADFKPFVPDVLHLFDAL